MKPGREREWVFPLVVFILVGVGGYFRFKGLGEAPLWQDEESTWLQALGLYTWAADGPLHIEITYGFMKWFRDVSNSVTRFPSAAASTLAIGVIAFAGRKLGGSWVGVLSAALLAFSPVMIFWGRMARPYGLFTLGVALMLWAFVAVLQSGRRRDWVCFGVASLLTSFVHLLTAQVLVGFFLWFAWVNGPRWKTVVFALISMMAWVPACYWVFHKTGFASPTTLVSPSIPPWVHLQTLLGVFGVAPAKFEGTTSIFITLALLGVWGFALARPTAKKSSVWALLAMMGLGLGMTVFSLGYKSEFFWSRYILHCVLFGYVLAAIGLAQLWEVRREVGGGLVLMLLLAYGFAPTQRITSTLRWDIQGAFGHPHSAIPVTAQAILVNGRQRLLGGLGRVYRGDVPVLWFKDDTPWGSRFHRTRRTPSRGGATTLLTQGNKIPFLPPGRYLVLSRGLKAFCLEELGGSFDPYPEAFRSIGTCTLTTAAVREVGGGRG